MQRVPSTAQPAPACTAEEMCKFITAPAAELETKVREDFTLTMGSMSISHSVLNVKPLLGAFNQEKALVGAFRD